MNREEIDKLALMLLPPNTIENIVRGIRDKITTNEGGTTIKVERLLIRTVEAWCDNEMIPVHCLRDNELAIAGTYRKLSRYLSEV